MYLNSNILAKGGLLISLDLCIFDFKFTDKYL